jgi:uncharacterized protein
MALRDYHLIFVHGYTSSSKGDWYPQIAEKLDKRGVSYSIPDLPGGDRPKASEWLKRIDKEVGRANKPVVLIGQSLGTRGVMLYLHEHPEAHLAAVFLIATFNNDVNANKYKRGEGYANFWEFQVNTEQLKRQAGKWVILHAYDDQNIPYAQAQDMAKLLDARLILSRGQAHFNAHNLAGYVLRQIEKHLVSRGGLGSWLGRTFRRA